MVRSSDYPTKLPSINGKTWQINPPKNSSSGPPSRFQISSVFHFRELLCHLSVQMVFGDTTQSGEFLGLWKFPDVFFFNDFKLGFLDISWFIQLFLQIVSSFKFVKRPRLLRSAMWFSWWFDSSRHETRSSSLHLTKLKATTQPGGGSREIVGHIRQDHFPYCMLKKE